jgi:branched-chain amino acid transport system substrate-binding protein
VGTPTTTRCLPLLKRHNDQSLLLFFPFSGAQPQRQAPYNEFVFNLRASYYQETAGLVDHFVMMGRRRFAVFYQIDAYGRNGWEGVRAALARHDLKMVAEATYPRGTPYSESMKQQVDILCQADADAVISIGSYAACAGFIRAARDAGWEVPIANVSFVGSENMLDLLQETGQANGTNYTRNLINSQVVPCYHDQTIPVVKEFRKLMLAHPPMPPPQLLNEVYQPRDLSFVSLEGFLNAKLLVAILEKMGPPFDRYRILHAAESLEGSTSAWVCRFPFGPIATKPWTGFITRLFKTATSNPWKIGRGGKNEVLRTFGQDHVVHGWVVRCVPPGPVRLPELEH